MPIAKLAASTLLLVVLVAPADAGDRNSQADQDACTPDVFRLCSDFIPDENRIVACLQAKGRQLSKPCHRVIFSPDPASSSPKAREASRRHPNRFASE